MPGPLFNLEDWFVHSNRQDPNWQPPNDLRLPQKADKLIKRSIQVVQRAGDGGESVSGREHMVALGDWIADFCRRYHGRGNGLANKVVQILWWNDIAGSEPGVSGNPFPYGNWYRGTVLSVSPKTGHLKVRFTDGEEDEVAMGVNFVHFGSEHPTGDQRARLPPPLPSQQPSPLPAAAGRLAGQLELRVPKGSVSGCSSGYGRVRPSGGGGGSGNEGNVLVECGEGIPSHGHSGVGGCDSPGSVLTSLRTLASQGGGQCQEQDPPSAKAGKARRKGAVMRKGRDVSCRPGSGGRGIDGHDKSASMVSPQAAILTASTTEAVLNDGGARPPKRPKVVSVGPSQLALSGRNRGEDGDGSGREAPPGGLDTGPPACAAAMGPTGPMATKTGVGNNNSHPAITGRGHLAVPGLETVSARTASRTASGPVLPPGGQLHPAKGASVLGSQEHQQRREQAALSPSQVPVVSTGMRGDSDNTQSPTKRAAKRPHLINAHYGTSVSKHAIGSHSGPHVESRHKDGSALDSKANLQQELETQNDGRTERLVKAEAMETVLSVAAAKAPNTTTGAAAGEGIVTSGQSSPGGCSQHLKCAPASHDASQAAAPSAVPLAEWLLGCNPPIGLQSAQDAEPAHNSRLGSKGLSGGNVKNGHEDGVMFARGGSISAACSDARGMGAGGSGGHDESGGNATGGSGSMRNGAADVLGSCERRGVGHDNVLPDGTASCHGATMGSNDGLEGTLRVADLGVKAGGTAAALMTGEDTEILYGSVDVTAAGPAEKTMNAGTMDIVIVDAGVDAAGVVGLAIAGLEAEPCGAAPDHTPGADVALECAHGAQIPASVAAGNGSTVAVRKQTEQIGGANECATALERGNREGASGSCDGVAGLAVAREGGSTKTAHSASLSGIEAPTAPSPAAADEEAAAMPAAVSIATLETQVELNGAEHPRAALETLTVPVHERQQHCQEEHLHESQLPVAERGGGYAGGGSQPLQPPLDALPFPGGPELAVRLAPEPWPQGLPMELDWHEAQPQSLYSCVTGITTQTLAQHSPNPGLPEEPAAAGVGLPRENVAGGPIAIVTGAPTPEAVGQPLVHHTYVAPLPSQHLKPQSPRERAMTDGAVGESGPGNGAFTAIDPGPHRSELVAASGIFRQGALGRSDSQGVRAGPPGGANAGSVLGEPSGINGRSVPSGPNKNGGDHLGCGDLGAGGHACQGVGRHGSSGDGGGVSAPGYILAPPPGLSVMVTNEWLAWWYVADSMGYGCQAAQALAMARQLLTNVQANFSATIEDCCRRLGCLPLHLRVLQVHYIQHAYVTLNRVPPEAGAKLANQLLLLIKLFVCETARETHRNEGLAGLSAMATAASPSPQPGPWGGCSSATCGTVGGATRHGQRTAMAVSSLVGTTQQQHPDPIQVAQQTHSSRQDWAQQTVRGLTLEEFWELMATCGSHCVQIIMIAIQLERAGRAIPKAVHDRLPSFADLLRWAASAVPAKPAAVQAAAPQDQRQCSLLPRFQVTMIRLAARLKAIREAAPQRVRDGSQENIAGAMTAVPRCPLPPRPQQPASQEGCGQRRQQPQPAGQSLRTDGNDAAGVTPSAISPAQQVKCKPAPLREHQDPRRCQEVKQDGVARAVQPWRVRSRQLYALLKRAGSRQEPSSGSASEYESDCDGTSVRVLGPPTFPGMSGADRCDISNPRGAQQGQAATSSELADAGEANGAGTAPIPQIAAPEPVSDGAPQSCITAKDLRIDMVTAIDIGTPALGKDAMGGAAGDFHCPPGNTVNGRVATAAVHVSGFKTSRSLFGGRGVLLRSCRTIVHGSKWVNEPFAVATSDTALGLADQTAPAPDPATIFRMDASCLATSVQKLITHHIQRPRPQPQEGTSSVAHVAAVTSAGRSTRSSIDHAPADDVPDAHASYGGGKCVARPTGLVWCQQGQQKPQVGEPETNRQMRLERVLAVWNTLPPPRQRALYLVSCRLGMGPDSLDEWWAMEMVVKALESLADAVESRRSPVKGAIDGFTEVREGTVAVASDPAPAAAAGLMADVDTRICTSGAMAPS
ncbi:hypothetical protein Vretifemale_6108 [Volvox reticuliferus]|uniref:Uncharacterized protein n=3 Tax=Volvox reticuliferus TaxID=1737510 RepID=A0A8J4C9G7_9CHLO|nr:hypothetical protein Vretifemale_6108 [Volvox reticuliferus]